MKNTTVKLLIASAFLGALCGLTIDLFIRALQFVSELIWDGVIPHAEHNPAAVIAIALIGGILMGLCVKYFGVNHGIGFEAVLASVKKDGDLGVKQLKRVVVNAFAGLATGASIGPENPITVIGGFTGTFLAKSLKMGGKQMMGFMTIAIGGSLGILMNSPVAGPILVAETPPTDDSKTNRLIVFCCMVAASVGFGVYLLLRAPLITGEALVPSYDGFKMVHLIYALFIGVIGTGIGLALKFCINKLNIMFARLNGRPVLRGAIVGLIIGTFGAIFPLVLFDGSAQLAEVVSNVSDYSMLLLLTLGVVRLLSTAVALSGGYQGGNIFPTIFIAGVIGLAINIIFPFIPAPVAMMACMVPAMYVFIPMPLFTIFLFTELGSFQLIPVMAIALTSAYVLLLNKQPKTAENK